MTSRDLSSILLGVAGITLVAAKLPESIGVGLFHIFADTQFSPQSDQDFIVAIAYSSLAPLLGLALFLLRDRLADRFFGGTATVTDRLNAADVQESLYSAVGLYLVVVGGSRLIGDFGDNWLYDQSLSTSFIFAWALQALLGLILLLRARGLAGLVRSLREIGRKK